MPSPRQLLWFLVPALITLDSSATIHYVDLNSPNPTPPYTNWPTAATNIQDAVDAANDLDPILVTNGTYRTGGRTYGSSLTNRVVLTRRITLQSVNGPAVTSIEGYHVPGTTNGPSAIRCVFDPGPSGSTIIGFTLTNGATLATCCGDGVGGGLYCYSSTSPTILSNCVIAGNSAASNGGGAMSVYPYSAIFNGCSFIGNSAYGFGGGGYGGGVYNGTCNNCAFISNATVGLGGGESATTCNDCVFIANSANSGGGGWGGTLNNCTIVSNSAASFDTRGGIGDARCNNCIVFYNVPGNGGGSFVGPSWTNCCTTPVHLGIANITNAPRFVNLAAGDLHLLNDSPCINAGYYAYVPTGVDFDGNPRISGGTVDIGAYEFQSPSSVLSYAWAQQYGLPTDGSADFADTDGDGMNNWKEWIAGTDPTNSLSVLKMFSPSNSAPGLKVSWQSVSGKSYFLQRGTNVAQPGLSTLQSNITGQAGTTIYNDTTATNRGAYFYRVGIQ